MREGDGTAGSRGMLLRRMERASVCEAASRGSLSLPTRTLPAHLSTSRFRYPSILYFSASPTSFPAPLPSSFSYLPTRPFRHRLPTLQFLLPPAPLPSFLPTCSRTAPAVGMPTPTPWRWRVRSGANALAGSAWLRMMDACAVAGTKPRRAHGV